MKKFKIILLFIILVTSLNASSQMQKQKVAIKMLNTMNKNRLLDKHIFNMIKMEVTANPILAIKKQEVTRFFLKHISFQNLKAQLANIYTRELTIKEMQQFTAFFDTSVGQKMILKMPRLIGLSSNLAQKKIQERYPELLNTFLKR